MRAGIVYAHLAARAAAPDAAAQMELERVRREHQKQLSGLKVKNDVAIAAIRQELAVVRRELNASHALNECYARKLKTYDGIAQLVAAAARAEPLR